MKQPAAPPPAGTNAVWVVHYSSASHAGLTNTATITASTSADQNTIDWYDSAADWATVVTTDTFTMVASIQNKNVGDTQVSYSMAVKVSSVSTVSDQNAGTSSPLILKDANGFWTVTYTDSAAPDKFTQFQDTATVTLTTGLSDALTATFTAGGGFAAAQAGAVYTVVMSYGGASLTLNFHSL